jgi:hypothetical protein
VSETGPTADELPPGVHLYVNLALGAGSGTDVGQLRILGDDRRGYLLAGLPVVTGDADAEFWFPTLKQAKRAAERMGVTESQWATIESLSQVNAR